MSSSRRVLVPLAVSLLAALGVFLGWEEGVPAYQRSQPVPPVSAQELLALPEQVYDPSPYAPATDEFGPPGPVSMVFRGRVAREGFTGEVAAPWYVVSARTGDYSRLEAPLLGRALGRLRLDTGGTRIAWVWPGGVATYDTVTGRSTSRRVPGVTGSTPLTWSPHSRWLAVGTDPVRLLDPSSSNLAALPLSGSAAAPPAWTADGRWLTVATRDTVTHLGIAGNRLMRFRGPVGSVREPAWNTADEMAGVHLIREPRQNVLRVVRTVVTGPDRGRAQVRDEAPEGIVIDRFLGWAAEDRAVVTGLRPDTGQIEQAVVASLHGGSVAPYILFPTLGDNWVGTETLSVATDLLREPTRRFESPTLPWAPVAKLGLCLLVAVFPVVYYLIARRPRG